MTSVELKIKHEDYPAMIQWLEDKNIVIIDLIKKKRSWLDDINDHTKAALIMYWELSQQ